MRVFRPAAGAVAVALLALPSGAAAAGERFEDVAQFGTGPGMDRVYDLARDAEGNTYVVGLTSGAFPGATNQMEADGFLVKLGPTGELVWADQFGGDDDSGENFVEAVAIDRNGDVWVTGTTQADLHATTTGYADAFVRKYSPDGAVLWGDQLSADSEFWDGGRGIAADGDRVHVVGVLGGEGFLRTYSLAGQVLSSRIDTGIYYADVVVDGGTTYVAGLRFDPQDRDGPASVGFVRASTATQVREVDFAVPAPDMRLAVNDDALVAAGVTWWGEAPEAAITQWDLQLRERWTWRGEPMPVQGVALTEAGDVFAGGIADWDRGEGVVRKHRAADGSVAWAARLDGAGMGVGALTVEGDRVVFAGATAGELVPGGVGAYLAAWPTVRTVPLTRLAGSDRMATAVAVSRAAFPAGASGAVLTSAMTFPDALVAAPLAAMVGGPVLQTGMTLPTSVGDELTRLLPPGGKVTIVGGTAVVPAAVEQAVRALGFDVERIAGVTRYDTAVEVARVLGGPPAIVVDGERFPDALVAGPASVAAGHAVVLTSGSTLPDVTRSYLLETGPGHVAVGGRAARAAPGAEAVVGVDRFETAVRVMERFFPARRVVGLASGTTFADALAIAPLLAREGAPLLLTDPVQLSEVVRPHVGLDLLEVYVAGGTDAIGQGVEQALQGLLTEAP